ncbi:hypothetical protein [Agreia sp. COWG]|uniref:hypothetical protein n=1 Tax=Agreia sp. COWG TaxID=2773266 RepID=UPI001928BFFF|nr:hypothetical protein [Agreia sp. COWG]CAD6006522.1 protein of unknown function [Agreia sp. COWG]
MFRSTTSADLGAVLSFSLRQAGADRLHAAPWVDALTFLSGHDAGNYRDGWTWLAILDGRPIARAVWWGPPGAPNPTRLDCLLVDPSVPHPEVWSGALVRSALTAFRAHGDVDTVALTTVSAPNDRVDRAESDAHATPADRARRLANLRR